MFPQCYSAHKELSTANPIPQWECMQYGVPLGYYFSTPAVCTLNKVNKSTGAQYTVSKVYSKKTRGKWPPLLMHSE